LGYGVQGLKFWVHTTPASLAPGRSEATAAAAAAAAAEVDRNTTPPPRVGASIHLPLPVAAASS